MMTQLINANMRGSDRCCELMTPARGIDDGASFELSKP